MKFSILILGAPYSSQAPFSALNFSRAALNDGHEISRVFLYGDGVNLATRLATPPQDELDIYTEWQRLINENQIDVVTCISAAARRGLINEQEERRHNKQGHNLAPEYALSGLGQLVDATIHSDHLITFGA